MSVLSDLQQRTKLALKAGQKEEVGALRMVIAELQRAAKDARRELDLDEEHKVLRRERKKLQESIEAFEAGGRPDLVAKTRVEADIIDALLPQQMGEAAVARLVDEVITESGATSPRDMGKVMNALMARAGGELDGRLASRLVKERLSP